MSEFSVNTKKVVKEANKIKDISTQYSQIQSRIYGVQSRLSSTNSSMAAVKNSLGSSAQSVGKLRSQALSLGTTLFSIGNRYERTDMHIMGEMHNFIAGVLEGMEISSEKKIIDLDDYFEKKTITINGKEIPLRKSVDETYEYKDGKWVKKPKDPDKKEKWETDVTIASKEHTFYDVAVAKGSVGVSGKYGSASADYKFLTSSASASGKISNKGIEGSLGFNAKVLEANAEGKLGNDLIGAYGKAGVEVGAVSAEVKGSLGLRNDDGKFSPHASLGGSAEAVLAKATGSAGVTVLGTDIGAKGEIGVGVGAHAKVGFEDGKFQLNVGAYVGVGGSVSLEVDCSKAVDFVADKADAAIDGAKNLYSSAKSGISSGWKKFKSMF